MVTPRQTKSPASKAVHAVVLRTTAPGVPLYGYRHYSPELGRWPSRDPMADNAWYFDVDIQAGVYLFVENSSLSYWDYLGQIKKPGKKPPSNWPTPGEKWKWDPGSGRWNKGGRWRHWHPPDDNHKGHWDDEDKNGNDHKNIYPFTTLLALGADACAKCLVATGDAINDAVRENAPIAIGVGITIIIIDIGTIPSGEGACGILLIKAALQQSPVY